MKGEKRGFNAKAQRGGHGGLMPVAARRRHNPQARTPAPPGPGRDAPAPNRPGWVDLPMAGDPVIPYYQNRNRISLAQTRFNCSASLGARTPKRRRSRVCSKQSNRDILAVEATRKPAAAQFCKATSVGVRGWAEVMAATTTSAASVHSTKTGRSFEAVPFVKGISAIQTSPGCGIVVKTLVLRGVAV